jgi:hypothetical protein
MAESTGTAEVAELRQQVEFAGTPSAVTGRLDLHTKVAVAMTKAAVAVEAISAVVAAAITLVGAVDQVLLTG